MYFNSLYSETKNWRALDGRMESCEKYRTDPDETTFRCETAHFSKYLKSFLKERTLDLSMQIPMFDYDASDISSKWINRAPHLVVDIGHYIVKSQRIHKIIHHQVQILCDNWTRSNVQSCIVICYEWSGQVGWLHMCNRRLNFVKTKKKNLLRCSILLIFTLMREWSSFTLHSKRANILVVRPIW